MVAPTKNKSKLEFVNNIILKFTDEYDEPLPDNVIVKLEFGDKDKSSITTYTQNGQVFLSKIPVGTVSLAVSYKNDMINNVNDQPSLKSAVNDAILSPEIFMLTDEMSVKKEYNIQEKGKLKINIRSKFEDNSTGDEKITVVLKNSGGKIISKAEFSAVTMSQVVESHMFDNLSEGKYKLSITRGKKSNPSRIKVKLWSEILSGPGVLGDLSNSDDKFELTTGVKAVGTKAQGRLFGEFVLRSEPVRQSYIFGKLPEKRATPIEVDVLDKKSFKRNGEDTWYKVKFKNKTDFEHYCNISFNYNIKFKNKANNKIYNVKVPVGFTNASSLFHSQQAWITGSALKIYLPFEKLQKMIEEFEKLPEIKVLPLLDRITYLRRLYDWDKKLRSEQVIRQTRAERKDDTTIHRSALSNLYSLINKHENTGFRINNTLFDAGHLFLTLDAYNHFDNLVRVVDSGVTLESGSARASASWSGDVGAAVSDYVVSQLKKPNLDRSKLDADELEQKYQSRAPEDDLVGNIFGVACYLLLREQKISSISDLLIKFSGNLNAYTKKALEYFLGGYGYSDAAQLLKNSHKSFKYIYEEIYQFGSAYLIPRLAKSKGGVVGTVAAAYEYFKREEDKFCRLISNSLTERFLQNVETLCRTYGVTNFDKNAMKSVIIPRIYDNPIDDEIKKFMANGNAYPGPETRKITPKKIYGVKQLKIDWAGAPQYLGSFKVNSGIVIVMLKADHEYHVLLDKEGNSEIIYVDLREKGLFPNQYEEIMFHEGTYTQAWYDIPKGEYQIGIRSNTAYGKHKLIAEVAVFEPVL